MVLAVVLGMLGPASAGSVSTSSRVNADHEQVYNHIFPDLVADPVDSARLLLVDVKRLKLGEMLGSCVVRWSVNGGSSWQARDLPLPDGQACRRVPPPKIVFASGKAYVAYYSVPRTATPGQSAAGRILVAGLTFTGSDLEVSAPVTVPLSLPEMALDAVNQRSAPNRIAVAADPDPNRNDVFVAWTGGHARRPVLVSRSTDGGSTFQDPVVVTFPKMDALNNFYTQAWSVAMVATGGRVYLSPVYGGCEYAEGLRNAGCWHLAVLLTTSDDRGATFSEAVLIANPWWWWTSASGPWVGPSLAVDPGAPERVYVVYEEESRGSMGYDAWLLRSSDGGKTFSQPVRVADDEVDYGYTHERPRVSVAPGGRVDVAWYDGRGDPTSVAPCERFADGIRPPCSAGRDVYYTYSTDYGATFARNIRITRSSFSAATRQIDRARGTTDAALGSIGLVSTRDEALLVWEQSSLREVATEHGTTTHTIWDLVSARVAQ